MDGAISRIAGKVLAGGEVTEEEAGVLAAASGPDVYDVLYGANRIRERFCGGEIHLCSIVNARSGACSEDCSFCAQSAHNRTDAPVYPMLAEERIIEAARAWERAGNFGIVTSGPDPGGSGDFDAVCRAAERVSSEGDVRVCVSLGRLTPGQVAKLKQAGVRRVHHNVETSRSFFPHVCTTHDYDDRIETVRNIQAAGLDVCCGGILGLGESWQDRVDMALELRDLDVDSVPINFLNPVPGTPCEKNEPLEPIECLKIIALFRFVLPAKQIRTAGGRERNLRDLQAWMYYAGANGTLIGNYLTTTGRAPEDDLQLISDLGLRVAGSPSELKPQMNADKHR